MSNRQTRVDTGGDMWVSSTGTDAGILRDTAMDEYRLYAQEDGSVIFRQIVHRYGRRDNQIHKYYRYYPHTEQLIRVSAKDKRTPVGHHRSWRRTQWLGAEACFRAVTASCMKPIWPKYLEVDRDL